MAEQILVDRLGHLRITLMEEVVQDHHARVVQQIVGEAQVHIHVLSRMFPVDVDPPERREHVAVLGVLEQGTRGLLVGVDRGIWADLAQIGHCLFHVPRIDKELDFARSGMLHGH